MSAAPDPRFASHQPDLALVLGSGLSPLVEAAEEVLAECSFEEAGLPLSTVPGHAGRLVLARVADRKVLFMQGRVHLYEGHTASAVAAGVRWLAAQGVRTLLLTNAAGSLRPEFTPGTWMMLSDHLNLTGVSPLTGRPDFVDMTEAYSATLRASFQHAATCAGMPLHEGVYAGLPGPQYETPAEIRMLQRLGADAVGMSTVLETIQARALGMEVAAFSCLTNWGAGLGAGVLDHHDVLQRGRSAAASFRQLFTTWLKARA